MAGPPRSETLWWTVPAAALLLIVSLAAVVGHLRERPLPGSSYDGSGGGLLAAYLLLDELGYPVERSRRPAGGDVRWVLFPERSERQARELKGWLRDGGRLVLADARGDFAADLGIYLQSREAPREAPEPVGGRMRAEVRGGSVHVDWPGSVGVTWATAGGRPLVSLHAVGRGEVWLIHRPEFLSNRLLAEADNGLVLCRLAEATLEGRRGPLLFDEFFHGYRDRPGVLALLLTPPTVWATLQGLLVLAIVLWRNVPRFGPLRPERPASRRSQEEFLDALAVLLQRRGDHAEACEIARAALLREMERDLDLPPGGDPDLFREAARARGLSEDRLRRLLAPAGPSAGLTPRAFVNALNELESLRDDFLARTRPGQL